MRIYSNAAIFLLLIALSTATPVLSAEESVLWGKNGELWSIDSRLPDFSYAGFGTFWNIRDQKPIQYPISSFGPPSMNLVFIQSDQKPITEKDSVWFETTKSGDVHPANLHEAQLKRRLEQASKK